MRSDMAHCSGCDHPADHLVQLKSHCDSGPHFGCQICMAAKKALASSVTYSGTTFASDRHMPSRQPGRRALGRWNLFASNLLPVTGGIIIMWTRWICAAAIFSAWAPQANAAEHSGVFHRASCTVVRFYVARYSAGAAETWARSQGATEAEIEAARRCLQGAPQGTAVQSASYLGSANH